MSEQKKPDMVGPVVLAAPSAAFVGVVVGLRTGSAWAGIAIGIAVLYGLLAIILAIRGAGTT